MDAPLRTFYLNENVITSHQPASAQVDIHTQVARTILDWNVENLYRISLSIFEHMAHFAMRPLRRNSHAAVVMTSSCCSGLATSVFHFALLRRATLAPQQRYARSYNNTRAMRKRPKSLAVKGMRRGGGICYVKAR